MLRQDIIEPAVSEWTSDVFLVKKKYGSLRFCIDYRRLNEASRKDMNPLSSIDSCVNAMAGAKWLSTLDLKAGYHQVKMDPVSVERTTFIAREGTFKFKVMPFGHTGAPAYFLDMSFLAKASQLIR